MELFIYDIGEDGLTLRLDSRRDRWFGDLMTKIMGDALDEGDFAHAELTFLRTDEDIDVHGEIALVSHPVCDRCLERYREEMTVPISMHMAPLYENERQHEREAEEGFDAASVKEDEAFSYYEGDRIHVDEIIAEQVVLAQPMKHLCTELCKGLCQRCGKNLNEGPCGCREEPADARWAALKDFKPRRKMH